MKKVAQVAGVVGGALLIATGIGGPAGLGLIGASLTATLGKVGLGLALAGAILGPKRPQQSPATRDRLHATLDPLTPRKIVFGRTAMATDVRYQSYTGTDQEFYHQIMCVASHEVEAIEEIWFDSELAWSAGTTRGKYVGYLQVTPRLVGTSANGIAIDNVWTAQCTLTGCAYLHLRYKLTGNDKKTDSPFAQSIPSRATVIGRGAKVPDVRGGAVTATDQATWAFAPSGGSGGRNPAIQLLFYMLGWRINGKLALGRGIPANRLDLDSFITAANMCDEPVAIAAGGTEPRYRSDGIFSEGDDPALVINNLLAAMNAGLRDDGGKISVHVLHNDLATPAMHFTEADILGDEEWKQTVPLDETFNVLRGKYTDPSPASLYQLVDYPEVAIASVDGIERIEQFDAALIQSPSQVQRLAKQKVQRNLYRGLYSATFNARAWALRQGDVVTLSHVGLGWQGKLFRVVVCGVSMTGRTQVVLQEEHPSIYAWDRDERPAVEAAVPTTYDPEQSAIVQAILEAAEPTDWPDVGDPDGTKPEDNATVGAPPGTNIGDIPVEVFMEALENIPGADQTPPEQVVDLSLSSSITQDTDGSQVVTLLASWEASEADDLNHYRIAITNGADTAFANAVEFQASSNRYEWRLAANRAYRVRVRAVDHSGNLGQWSAVATITTAKDDVPPAPPTSPAANSGPRIVWLSWINAGDADLAHVEIWEGTSANVGSAIRIATVNAEPGKAGGYSRAGLAAGATRNYWLRSIDSSGNASAYAGPVSGTSLQINTPDIAAEAIYGYHIRSNTVTGNIFEAGSSLPGSLTIGQTGFTLSAVAEGNADPAARINAGTTLVEAGKITLAGYNLGTIIGNWRDPGDITKINGGVVSANSILTQSLQIGARGVRLVGVRFEANRQTVGGGVANNWVAWTAGAIEYLGDDGAPVSVPLSAGNAVGGGTPVYLVWVRGSNAIAATTVRASAYGADRICIATYRGGTDLNVHEGRTTITGEGITTGSVDADVFRSGTVLTQDLYVGGTRFALRGSFAGAGKGALVISSGDNQSGVALFTLGWIDAANIGWRVRNYAGQIVMDSFHDPIESGADVTTAIKPFQTQRFQFSFDGTIKAGQVPRTVQAQLLRSTGENVTTQATWQIVTSNCTATISATGLITITAVANNGWIDVRATRNGKVYEARLTVTRDDDAPPQGGGTPGTPGTEGGPTWITSSWLAVDKVNKTLTRSGWGGGNDWTAAGTVQTNQVYANPKFTATFNGTNSFNLIFATTTAHSDQGLHNGHFCAVFIQPIDGVWRFRVVDSAIGISDFLHNGLWAGNVIEMEKVGSQIVFRHNDNVVTTLPISSGQQLSGRAQIFETGTLQGFDFTAPGMGTGTPGTPGTYPPSASTPNLPTITSANYGSAYSATVTVSGTGGSKTVSINCSYYGPGNGVVSAGCRFERRTPGGAWQAISSDYYGSDAGRVDPEPPWGGGQYPELIGDTVEGQLAASLSTSGWQAGQDYEVRCAFRCWSSPGGYGVTPYGTFAVTQT